MPATGARPKEAKINLMDYNNNIVCAVKLKFL